MESELDKTARRLAKTTLLAVAQQELLKGYHDLVGSMPFSPEDVIQDYWELRDKIAVLNEELQQLDE